MTPIPTHRMRRDYSQQRLKRARRLYVFLIRQNVEDDRTGQLLEVCALRMIESGLLKANDQKSARYSILRGIWKRFHMMQDGYDDTFGWHRWRSDNGWGDGFRRNRKAA